MTPAELQAMWDEMNTLIEKANETEAKARALNGRRRQVRIGRAELLSDTDAICRGAAALSMQPTSDMATTSNIICLITAR
jgi:hypothetical protein